LYASFPMCETSHASAGSTIIHLLDLTNPRTRRQQRQRRHCNSGCSCVRYKYRRCHHRRLNVPLVQVPVVVFYCYFCIFIQVLPLLIVNHITCIIDHPLEKYSIVLSGPTQVEAVRMMGNRHRENNQDNNYDNGNDDEEDESAHERYRHRRRRPSPSRTNQPNPSTTNMPNNNQQRRNTHSSQQNGDFNTRNKQQYQNQNQHNEQDIPLNVFEMVRI
jgi:hypothetical protein